MAYDPRFIEVSSAIVDEAGNLYCAGTLPGTEDHNDGYYMQDDERGLGGNRHFVLAIWSYDPSFRLRWCTETRNGRLAIHASGTLVAKCEDDAPVALAMANGAALGDVNRALLKFDRVVRDQDGSYITSWHDGVGRLDPTRGYKEVPIFARGFLGSLFSADTLPCINGAAIAVASDGDLVVHHVAAFNEKPRILRYGRRGEVRCSSPSPLSEQGSTSELVAGANGLVWGYGGHHLCAVTPTGVEIVALPAESLGKYAFACMPDGSLLFFGHRDGRILRAGTRGATLTGIQVVQPA